jgi:hypothetical protein
MLNHRNWILNCLNYSGMCVALLLVCSHVHAQNQTEQPSTDEATSYQAEFADAEEQVWEFGMKLSCTGGYAKTIVGSSPLPMEWPEQEVELFEETKSSNVGKIKIRNLKGHAKLMTFTVARMNDGETAEAILRFRVKRSNSLPPEFPEQFRIAKKIPTKLKTFLKPSPFIESNHKKIKEIGQQIFEDNKDECPWDQVQAIYSWVRENVTYKFDKKIHTCVEAIESGTGDCEELSSLFIAICRSQGIPARAVWVPGHTYPEFYLEDETGKGHWFPCQAAGALHEFGEIVEDRPILQKGDRFKLPVSKETKRYVEHECWAKESTGVVKIEAGVMNKVESE